MRYLHPRQLLYLYRRIIEETGGSYGLRDEGLLESAACRPMATFGGRDLYPDLFIKAAAVGHSLIRNQPFVDGNKRVGFEAMRLTLRLNGFDLDGTVDEKFDFVMDIATGKLSEQAIADWLEKHSRPHPGSA